MSHYTLLAILPKGTTRLTVEINLAKLMETFDEGKETMQMMGLGPKRWDWYTIGGRWNRAGQTPGNIATVKEFLDAKWFPVAILTPEQAWIEDGQTAWFGMSTGTHTEEEQNEMMKGVMEKYLDYLAVNVDCHI